VTAQEVVGIRATRRGPLMFAWSTSHSLPRHTPVLVQVGETFVLAAVTLEGRLIQDSELDAVTANVVAAGSNSVDVQAAIAERDSAALQAARRIAGAAVAVLAAHWRLDRSFVTVVVQTDEPGNLTDLGERLVGEFKALVRFEMAPRSDSPRHA
jgi:hypothetical protein